jgi:MADS-box transcription factor
MLGENLSVLTVPDLLLLEQQLDMGVSRIRARKNQLLLEEIDNLRRKERDLQQVNEELRQKALELQQMPVEWQKL